jgi:molybdopterin/thiamine biosynthesis adenylyltransferase
MNDEQLLRYSRQILLPEIGTEGQLKLAQSRVLIIGVGGLGSPAAMYLAAAGIGALILSDPDQVELSNLQRQIIHDTAAIGTDKVVSARQRLKALNAECQVHTIPEALSGDELTAEVAGADLVLDCSDNFATRFAVNAACVATGTPLVSGAAIRWEGQIAVYSGHPDTPCYRCLYGEVGEPEDTCTSNGVLAPVVGVIGSMQAVEAIKLLTGAGEPLTGRLLILDALHMHWRELKLKADPACPVCGEAARQDVRRS